MKIDEGTEPKAALKEDETVTVSLVECARSKAAPTPLPARCGSKTARPWRRSAQSALNLFESDS